MTELRESNSNESTSWSDKLHVSASQLKTYASCPRKHWLQKVGAQSSDKPKTGAERGKKLHGLVESFIEAPITRPGQTFLEYVEESGLWEKDLRHGIRSTNTNPELLDFREAYHSDAGAKVLVEQRFTIAPVFVGIMDLVVINEQGEVRIIDHKFMSDKRYTLTEEKALEEYQLLMYAKAALEFFQVKSVTFEYHYYGTRYCWEKKLKINLTPSDICAKWLGVLEEASSLLDNYTIQNARDTQPNYLSCGQYGGCEFKDICFGG